MESKLYEAFFWIEPSQGKDSSAFNGTKVIWHHPDDVSNVIRSFKNIPQFCFPDLENIKIENINNKSKSMRKSEHFTFTLQEQNGSRVYGICFRSLFSGVLGRFDTPRRARHCLCFITRNPYFSLFRLILLQVHALCLLSKDVIRARHFLDIINAQANQCLSLPSMANMIYCNISKNAFPGTCNDIVITSARKSGLRLSSKEVAVLPLLELLGTEKLLALLGAVLCERRVLFIANDVEVISNSVLAIASLIDPFSWQHVFIPLLPGKLLDYASAPMPYLIGLRKYWYDKIPSDALGDVLVVDVDSGDMKTFGTDVLKNTDFVGESASTLNQVTETFDRVFAKAGNVASMFGLGSKGAVDDTGPRDIVAFIVSEIKAILTSKPGANVITSVATGILRTIPGTQQSREELLVQWAAESEKALRDIIMYFFVYLFAIFDDFAVTSGSPTKSADSSKGNDRGVALAGNAFGQGDSRANFNINAFKNRRRQLGDSAGLLSFVNELMHSQIFEQFCDEQVKKRGAMATGKSSDEFDIFDVACKKLRSSRQPITVSSAKAVVTECSRGEANDKMGLDFHNLTYQFTEDGQQKIGIQQANQTQSIIGRICNESFQSNNLFRILKTIKIRLDSGVASGGRGAAGASAVKALQLLKSVLVCGPEAATSYSLDFIPHLRRMIRKFKVGEQRKGAFGVEVLDFMSERDHSSILSSAARAVLDILVDTKALMIQRRAAFFKTLTKEAAKSKDNKLTNSDSFFETSSAFSSPGKYVGKQELMTTINVGGGQCNRSFPKLSSINARLKPPNCTHFSGTLILKSSSSDLNEPFDFEEGDEQGINFLPDSSDIKDDNSVNAKYRIVNKDTGEVLDLRELEKMKVATGKKIAPNVPILSPPPAGGLRASNRINPSNTISSSNKNNSNPNSTLSRNPAPANSSSKSPSGTSKTSAASDPFFSDPSADSWNVSSAPSINTTGDKGSHSNGSSNNNIVSFNEKPSNIDGKSPVTSTIFDPFAIDPTVAKPSKPPASKPVNLIDDFDLLMTTPLKSNINSNTDARINTSTRPQSNLNVPSNPFDSMSGFNNNSFNTSNTMNNNIPNRYNHGASNISMMSTSSNLNNMNSRVGLSPPFRNAPIDPFSDLVTINKTAHK